MSNRERQSPALAIHAGAGGAPNRKRFKKIRSALERIRAQTYRELADGESARSAVASACGALEDCELFNAGTGSKLQADGIARLSASIMSGESHRFSGIVNVEEVRNPVELADALQDEGDRILAGEGTQRLARRENLPLHDPATLPRLENWIEKRRKELEEGSEAENSDSGGTVGAVAFDCEGRLAAGTSTGGKGFETPGRVSDTALPSGNYATTECAASFTGTGEDIIDEAAAARLCIRARDFDSLEKSCRQTFREMVARDRSLGAIALDQNGNFWWGKTTGALSAAYRCGEHRADTLGAAETPLIDSPDAPEGPFEF